MLKCYLLSFLMTTIVFLCLITEVNMNNMNTMNNMSNMRNEKNTINTMRNSSMACLDCLDQLILVVHLPDASVTNTNDCFYLL